jgi:tetratricopeptide (TPR) repeat protein
MVAKPSTNDGSPADPAAMSSTMVGVAPRLPRPSGSLKQTMIGVAPDLQKAAEARAKATNKHADLPAAAPPRPPPAATNDLPAPAVQKAELPAPAVQKAALPAPAAQKPAVPARPPVPERKAAIPADARGKPPPPVRRSADLDSELPAALAFGSKPRRGSPDVAAGTGQYPTQPAPAPSNEDDDLQLPELAKEPPLVKGLSLQAPAIVSDLPMPGAAVPHFGIGRQRELDIDLDLPLRHESGALPQRRAVTQDDLEINLPSPLSTGGRPRGGAEIDKFEFDLDLPSPSSPPASAKARPGTPFGNAAASETNGFGEVDLLSGAELAFDTTRRDSARDLNFATIPDLDSSLGPEKKPAATADSADAADGFRLPDLTDALPIESGPPRENQSFPPNAGLAELGREYDLGAKLSGEATVSMAQRPSGAPPVSRTSAGGGTDFGEVSLDVGSGSEQSIAVDDDIRPRDRQVSADLEFGGIPEETKPGAKTEAPVDAPVVSQRKRTEPAVTKAPTQKAARFVVWGSLAVLVLGGAALSLVPDVGPFGSAYISDRLRKAEYERLLAAQSSTAQRLLAQDLYPEALKSLQQLESVQKAYPRARGLKAYRAFVAYALDLRFGASPERNSHAKVLLAQLTGQTDLDSLELAEAARAADERNLTRAHQRIDDIRRSKAKRVEVLTLSAQIEMLDRRPGQALVYWRDVESFEHSARSAYGCATAELALGQTEASEQNARAALARQPRHVGARLLLARIAMDKRGDAEAAEKLLSEVQASVADASPAEQVSMFTMLGDMNLTRSRISSAESAYSKALASDPRCSGALRGLGEALYRAGRFAEALARFEAAVQADPDDSTAAVGVAKTQLSLERVRDAVALLTKLLATHAQSFLVNYWYGAALEAVGNREEAEKAFTKAVQLGGNEPASIDAYVSLALLKNQQGRREEAQKLLEAARAKLPLSTKLLGAIGQLALAEGRYEAAIAGFRQALALDPTDISARFRLGIALRKNRAFDEAMSCFEAVAKVDAEFPGLALERGLLYETSGRTDEALKAFEDALAKAPNDPDLMLRVGCGKVAAGRPKEAETLLRKVLEQRPMSAETHHCLGRAQLLEGTNLALALRTLERAVELDPYRPEYYLYVGWAANEAGRITAAEQALKKAISLDQGLGDAYWQRGVLRFRQGAVKDAVADLTKAIELRPNRVEAHAALAEAFYELGLEVKALDQWHIAVQAQPENAAWHFSYGKLLQALNRDAEARTELEQALELGAKLDPAPRWIWEAHRLLARSLGMQPAAIPHWQAYLRLSPMDHAYRDEAKAALQKLGQPWQDGG